MAENIENKNQVKHNEKCIFKIHSWKEGRRGHAKGKSKQTRESDNWVTNVVPFIFRWKVPLGSEGWVSVTLEIFV